MSKKHYFCTTPCHSGFVPGSDLFFHSGISGHIGRPEPKGQQFVHAALDEILRRFGHDHVQLRPAELEQCLTAHTAGRGDLFVHLAAAAAHHCNIRELGHAVGHGLEQGRALCAAGGGKGRIFHVAAGVDASVLCAQGSTHHKIGISTHRQPRSSRSFSQ